MKRTLINLLVLLWAFFPATAQNPVWHNPQSEAVPVIDGRGWPAELKGTYNRLPTRCEGIIRESVWNLSTQCAGLYIKFRTDSPTIKVRYSVTGGFQMNHMPATGVSGVDLYSRDADRFLRWYGSSFRREFKDTVTMTYANLSYVHKFDDGYEFTLYLPLYNHVSWMEIGVDDGSAFHFLPASEEKPIVVYGTSIAQGACATRPGLAWTNIIQHDMEARIINLGFSGNGQLEEELFKMLAEIDASVYVIDCMANMDGDRTKLIYDRTLNGVHILRSKNNAPIILVEHAGYSDINTSDTIASRPAACNVELDRAYSTLLQEGVRDLYLIPQSENAYAIDEMVEGWHPNDIGMQHQARVTEKYIHIATGK